MSVLMKCAGIAAGIAAVGALGVAIAQGPIPRADVSNPALAAGQQSTRGTPMGETGIPVFPPEVRVVPVMPAPQVAAAPPPEPAPAPVAQAPEPPQTTTLGAPPEPAPPAKADRG
jgi:hypothetical protein